MKRLILIVLTSMLCIVASTGARAQETEPKQGRMTNRKRGPDTNPRLKITNVPTLMLPDLVVTSASFVKEGPDKTMHVRVTVQNTCGGLAMGKWGDPSGAFPVRISFMDLEGKVIVDKQGNAFFLYYYQVKPLKGGESDTHDWEVPAGLPAYSYVIVNADFADLVKEANEKNNWWKLKPSSSTFPDRQSQCNPKG